MELLILLLVIFVFFPLFKVFFAVGKTAHTFKKAYDQQAKQYKKAQEQKVQEKKKNHHKERVRAYYKEAGEDVEFEEVKIDRKTQPTEASNNTSSNEPHITDANYEEIK